MTRSKNNVRSKNGKKDVKKHVAPKHASNAKKAAGKGGGASKVAVKLGNDKSRQRARKNFATAGLQSSGLSQNVSREIASGGYEYMGPSPSTSTQYADIHDAMAIAQLLTLHMVARWPTMFNVPPLIGPSTVVITPSTVAAYLMLAYLQRLYDRKLLSGSLLAACSSIFTKEWVVPVGWAKWMEYKNESGPVPVLLSKINYSSDLILPSGEILGPGNANNFSLSQFQVNNQAGIITGFENFACFATESLSGDGTGDQGLITVAQTFTGLVTGANPFCNSPECRAISDYLKGVSDITTVPFKDIAIFAPDTSAWSIPYGQNGGASLTSWAQYTAMMNPTPKFDADLSTILTLNFNVATSVPLPFPLGFQKMASMPTLQVQGFNSTGVSVLTATAASQLADFFCWTSMRNGYQPGKIYGKKGWKLYGRPIPHFTNWVGRSIDTYQIYRLVAVGVCQYMNTSLLPSILSDENWCSIFWLIDTLLTRKIFDTGNPNLLNGIGANNILAPQCLIPATSEEQWTVPVFIKAIIDQVGIVFSGNTMYVPTLAVNLAGTLAGGAGIFWYNWPRYGFIPQAVGGNRCFGNSINGVNSFPFIPIGQIEVDNSGNPVVGQGPDVPAGKAAQITNPNGAVNALSVLQCNRIINSSTSLAAAMAAPTIGGYLKAIVYWNINSPAIAAHVNSLFSAAQVDARGLMSKVNGADCLGGPSMLTTQVRYPTPGTVQTTIPVNLYCVNNNNLVSAPKVGVVQCFDTYFVPKVFYYAPLSPGEQVLALAFPVAAVYKNLMTPNYPLTSAYTEEYVNNAFDPLADSMMTELISTKSMVSQDFIADEGMKHTKVGIIEKAGPKGKQKDCLRRGLIKFANLLASDFVQGTVIPTAEAVCGAAAAIAPGPAKFLGFGCPLIGVVAKSFKTIHTNYTQSITARGQPRVEMIPT